MESKKVQIQITAKGEGSKIQISQSEKKVQVKEHQEKIVHSNEKKQLLMKLYVYGSCESDQFRHPSKLSESKRPICLTNIQKFDLNDDDDDEESEKEGEKKDNIYVNPLYKKSVYKIACGGLHSVVVTTDGKAYTFGCNDEGALGRKGAECVPMEVVLDHPVDLVSAGDNHTMFANSVNGIVYFTGNYNYLRGEKMIQNVNEPIKFTTVSLDIRNRNHPIQKLVSGANHTCILVNNKIFCRGEPESFTTGRRINERRKTSSSLVFDGVGLNNVVDVWCGGYHTVAKIKKGKDFVYHTWGKNDQGQLGIGSFKSEAYPVQIKSLKGKNIVKVAAGTFFTIFLTDNGQILGCGSNQYGQLGLGQDYEFVPSEGESDEEEEQEQDEKQQDLENDVKKLHIEESVKNQNEAQILIQNQTKPLGTQPKPMQAEPQSNVNVSGQQQNISKMVSQNQQKVIPTIPNPNGSIPSHIDQQKVEQQSQKKKFQQKNTYIKSVRPLTFPEDNAPQGLITSIAAGSQFAFAWNNLTQLYSWGFGMNYVLLTGQQDEEYEPFKVRNKIINDEIIDEISAGGQHVLYTAYEKTESKSRPNVVLDEKVTQLMQGRLSRKRKN